MFVVMKELRGVHRLKDAVEHKIECRKLTRNISMLKSKNYR